MRVRLRVAEPAETMAAMAALLDVHTHTIHSRALVVSNPTAIPQDAARCWHGLCDHTGAQSGLCAPIPALLISMTRLTEHGGLCLLVHA